MIDLKIKIAWLVKSLLVFLLEIQGGKYYTLVLNSIMKHLAAIGQYFLMIREVFKKPTKWKVMRGLILKEIDELIYGSMGIVIFVSFFIDIIFCININL